MVIPVGRQADKIAIRDKGAIIADQDDVHKIGPAIDDRFQIGSNLVPGCPRAGQVICQGVLTS